MLVIKRSYQTVQHGIFEDIPRYFREGDLLVLNNTKVLPARLYGHSQDGKKLEALLLTGLNTEGNTELTYHIYPKRYRDLKEHEIQWDVAVPPLPPYIKRKHLEDYSAEDYQRYQTVFAQKPGSAAAPTSGFHFTPEILQTLENKGVEILYVTLHIGLDTFEPVRVERVEDHKMHGEVYFVPDETAQAIGKAKKEGRRVTACGTTVVRALESWAEKRGLSPFFPTITHLFIIPGFPFKIVDRLITNFHQPKSTLLMLVSAFAGRELIGMAYEEAIRKRYRLFSYGDCMLIE